MANPMIFLENMVKTYRISHSQTTILQNISLEIQSGEFAAVVGASGSGKTTLMNIIGLLDKADSGIYKLNGQSVTDLSGDQLASLRNQQIGFVFQQFNLLPRFTALQNVALPLTYRKLKQSEVKERAYYALEQVGMADFADHRPTQLSGGQQQRVAIARALIPEPQLILADEPTGALDSRTGQDIFTLFHQMHASGKTILMITHDTHLAAQCARQIALADGCIVQEAIA